MAETPDIPSAEHLHGAVTKSFWVGLAAPGMAQMLAQRTLEGIAWLALLAQAWIWFGWEAAVTVHLLSAFRTRAIMARHVETLESWRPRTSSRMPVQTR